MKEKRIGRRGMSQAETAPIRTTFMELIQELSKLTQDDSVVMAAVRNIFTTYNVVATRTLAPVKLVATVKPIRARANRRGTCWA
jgi:Holliday junction resolvasome RuvABC endonuclease subunit